MWFQGHRHGSWDYSFFSIVLALGQSFSNPVTSPKCSHYVNLNYTTRKNTSSSCTPKLSTYRYFMKHMAHIRNCASTAATKMKSTDFFSHTANSKEWERDKPTNNMKMTSMGIQKTCNECTAEGAMELPGELRKTFLKGRNEIRFHGKQIGEWNSMKRQQYVQRNRNMKECDMFWEIYKAFFFSLC